MRDGDFVVESAKDTPDAGDLHSDAELVRGAVAGDTAAFEPLVRRYSDMIVRFSHHMVGDFQAAEDIAQEAFLKAFSHIGRLEDAAKFTTWLYSIARHLCLDWIRARRSTVSMDVLESDGVEIPGDPDDLPERYFETGEMHGQVLAELQRLRPDYREILLMKHVYELSYKEIGEVAGLSVSAVGEKLSRVRELLRKRLRKVADSQAGR
jgi:RNA polymerase sigma-70 factor (ECF subfamily)